MLKSTALVLRWSIPAILAVLLVAGGSICPGAAAAAEYGRLETGPEPGRAFAAGRQLPDHAYYYSGMVNVPDGIIGIRSDYTLKTTLWKEVDAERQNFRELVGQMKITGGHAGELLHAMWILDPRGERIGVWLSELDRTTIRMLGDREVEISTPGTMLLQWPNSGGNRSSGR